VSKASAIQTSFNAGELSPTLDGRVDIGKYASGCSILENFIPLVQGGARKRSGTRFVKEVKDSNNPSRLIPFEFNTDQAYVLEFAHSEIRVFRDGGPVTGSPHTIVSTSAATPVSVTVSDEGTPITAITQASPAVVTAASHGFEDGDRINISGITGVAELNDREFTVAGKTADQFALLDVTGTISEDTTQITDATCDVNANTSATMDDTEDLKVGQTVDGAFSDATCITTLATTVTMTSNAALAVGMTVSGTGIPAGATIASIPGGGTTFVLSAAATVASSPGTVSLEFNPIAAGTTVAAIDAGGTAFTLSAAALSDKDNVTLKFGGPWVSGGSVTGHRLLTNDELFLDGTGIDSIDGRFWTISRTGALTFTLDSSINPGEASTVGTAARIFKLASPYSSEALGSMQYAQSADVLYIAHPDYPPHKVTRTEHDAWTITEIVFDDPPFEPRNTDTDITVKVSTHDKEVGETVWLEQIGGVDSGSTDNPIFAQSMEGSHFKISELIPSNHGLWEAASDNIRYSGTPVIYIEDVQDGYTAYWENNVYRLRFIDGQSGTSAPVHDTGTESDGKWQWEFLHSGSGHGKIISASANGINAQVEIINPFPVSVVSTDDPYPEATHRWARGAWGELNGYPRTVTFFEDRLWWGGTRANPQTLWASKTSDYENHQIIDLDESALVLTINTDKVNVIEWINAGKVLVIGTAGGEFVCSAAVEAEALVPGNVRVVRHSTYGSKTKVLPQRVEQVLLFVQRAGRKMREFVYNSSVDSFVAPDMTVLAEHITRGGMTELAFQQEPNRLIWATLGNGNLICFTYERAQEVVAWHRHELGGEDVFVESIASIPHPNGDKDQLWLIVKRTVDGATKRYIEYMESDWDRFDEVDAAFFVDSGLSYDGDPTTTLTHLEHLEGETVTILADGATHPDQTVSDGQITLTRSCEKASVGLAYSSTLQTMRIEAGAADGTAQGKTKRFTNVVFRLDQTGSGLFYGPDDTESNMEELHFRDSYHAMSEALPLFDGDTEVLPWPEGYEQIGRIALKHTLPLPCTITAIMAQVVTQDR